MFGLLKEKLKSWASKFSKSVEKDTEESKIIENIEKKKLQKKETKKQKPEKKQKETKIKEKHKEQTTQTKEIIKEEEQETREELKKEIEEPQEERQITKLSTYSKQSEDSSTKQGFFSKLISKVTKVKVSEEEFNIYSDELEMLLLENNVALEVAEKIIKELKEKIVGKEFLRKEIEGQIKEAFKDVIYDILIEPFDLVEKIKLRNDTSKPYVILFSGINGTGKTTTIAKLADFLKKQKLSCVLAAADTFRAASIEQLKKHGEKIGVPVIAHDYESDPAAVGFDAIKYAEKSRIDCVLIDTAGRMHTAKNLMAQIEKVSRVCKPDLKIYVGESTTGNDAVEQIKSFNFSLGIDGIILTKADIDEKGGTALSVGYVTKKPILYLGTGQDYDSIEPFNRNKFVEKLGL